MILGPQPLIPIPPIDAPKLLFRVVGVCVQPFQPAQVAHFALEGAVGIDEGGEAAPVGAPDANVDEVGSGWCWVLRRGSDGMGEGKSVHGGFGVGTERAEPERVDGKVLVHVLDELLRGLARQCQVLDDERLRLSAGVQRLIHFPGTQQRIQEPARNSVEGRPEHLEGVGAHPEGAAVVPEDVVLQGDALSCGTRFGSVQVEPGVMGAGETLDFVATGRGEAAEHDNAVVEGKEDAVDVVVGFLRGLGEGGDGFGSTLDGEIGQFDVGCGWYELDFEEGSYAQGPECASCAVEEVGVIGGGGLDDVPVGEHNIAPIDRPVEEAVFEGATLAGCT